METTTLERPIDRLLPRLAKVKKTGDGTWRACCPEHEDAHPSLDIKVASDGTVLLQCRSHNCNAEAICKALGWELRDLFPQTAKAQHNRQAPRAAVTTQRRVYDSVDAVIDALSQTAELRGGQVTRYEYTHSFVVVRFDFADDRTKEFRPVHKTEKGWGIGDPPGRLPLYRGNEVSQADTVFVCEGEKCCDAAWAIGLPTVTSAHGAQSSHKSDWSSLSRKQVVILPDNNGPGRKYAEAVAGFLHRLGCSVKIVSLPELPDGGDMVDWAEKNDGKSPEALRAMIEQLAVDAPEWKPPVAAETSDTKPGPAPVWKPFLVAALPKPLRFFVVEGARAIGCDPSMIALPMLASCAAAIGTTRRVKLKNSWCEPSVLWTAIVARSGTLKSPASELAVKPLQRVQSEQFREHRRALAEYEKLALHHEASKADWWRNTRGRGDPPEKPEPPVCVRHVVSDCTVESLAPILSSNPRGVLLAKDELSGWLRSFNQYKGSKGSDVANWLEMHRAGCVTVDRKTQQTLHVPRAAVSICGTIQPGVLSACLTDEYFAAGLSARLLIVQPPTPAKRWTDDDMSPATFARFEDVIRKLLAQEHDRDDDGELVPKDLPLSADARARWIDFYNEFAVRQADAPGEDLAAAFSKIEGYAARFALLCQCVGFVTGTAAADCVDDVAMEAGITLARWFADEAERVYGLWHESDEDREWRDLIAWIENRGAETTPGDLQRDNRTYRNRGDAQAALDDLVAAKLGAWEYVRSDARDGTQRGRQSKVFRLSVNSVNVNDNGCDDSASANFVDVDNVDGGENEVGEWAG